MKLSSIFLVLALLLQLVPTPALRAQSVQATAAGDQIVYTAEDGRPTLIDLTSRTTTTLIQKDGPYFRAWSPDGNSILYLYLDKQFIGGYDLWVSNADGSNLRRYSDSPDYQYIDIDGRVEAVWAANGTKIAYHERDESCEDDIIKTVGADFRQPQTVFAYQGCSSSTFDWSRDGRTFVFVVEDSGGTNSLPTGVYLVNADGSSPRRIVTGLASSPRWSPDGTKLALVERGADLQARLVVRNADGSHPVLLSNGGGGAQWSPDGSRIAFSGPSQYGPGDIFVVNADGSNLTNLTKAAEWAVSPAWSPDGTKIVFTYNYLNGGILSTIDINGAHLTRWGVAATGELGWRPQANVLMNPGFEVGTPYWQFVTNGQSAFTIVSPGNNSASAGRVKVTTQSSTIQLFQKGVRLAPSTRYRLRFAARSNSGHDLSVYLQNHTTGVSYGLSNFRVNLTTGWKNFTIDFTSKNIASLVADGRLRFWFGPYAKAGDLYWIDNVSLEKLPASTAAAEDAPSQTGSINGHVVTELLAAGPATVSLKDMESDGAALHLTTQPDASGAFQFDNVPYGNYEVSLQPAPGQSALEAVQLAVSEEANEEILFGGDAGEDGNEPASPSQLFLPLITR